MKYGPKSKGRESRCRLFLSVRSHSLEKDVENGEYKSPGVRFDNYKQLESIPQGCDDLKLEAEIEIVPNMNEIMKWPIISTPVL